jgi:polygalacturonase
MSAIMGVIQILAVLILFSSTSLASKVCDIRNYGAKGNGKTKNTKAIQAAVDACCCSTNGLIGTVFVPDGIYLTGSFVMKSFVQLNITKTGVILGSNDESDYPLVPVLPSYGTGRDVPTDLRYRALVFAENATDLSIVGGGTIDGDGHLWWRKHFRGQLKWSRPPLVELMSVSGIKVHDITMKNSPFWTFHPYSSSDVHVSDSTFLAPSWAPNTDGIDIDSCNNVLVEKCYFSVGDDGIAIKSGLNEAGRDYGVPSSNIVIRSIVVEPAEFDNLSTNGVSIGSEMSGGVRNVTVEDSTFSKCESGIYIKSMEGRGGVVQDISFKRIHIQRTLQAIRLSMNYVYRRRLSSDNDTTPHYRNIKIEDVTGSSCAQAGYIIGLDNSVIENLQMSRVNISSKLGWFCKNVEGRGMDVSPPLGRCFS